MTNEAFHFTSVLLNRTSVIIFTNLSNDESESVREAFISIKGDEIRSLLHQLSTVNGTFEIIIPPLEGNISELEVKHEIGDNQIEFSRNGLKICVDFNTYSKVLNHMLSLDLSQNANQESPNVAIIAG